MLNLAEGEELSSPQGRAILATGRGRTHLIFGPYRQLQPGSYVASFRLARPAGAALPSDRLCAILDIATADGSRIIATRFVFGDELGDAYRDFALPFSLSAPAQRVELRVRASREAPVVALDDPTLSEGAASVAPPPPACDLIRHDPGEVVDLFARGYDIRRGEDCLRFISHGLTIEASERDDLNFAGEVLEHRVYNVITNADACVIDIGMNVGLTSLSFARKPYVREVHAYEPFASTFSRARRNLAANPAIREKIAIHNVGLSDHGGDETVYVPATRDSGSRATISVAGGEPITLRLRDAGAELAPIIARARSRARQIIVKMDCEGSEFAIFDSLRRVDLLRRIDVFLVEWHAMFAGKTAEDLIAPLVAAGFTVIDLSPDEGNGFFYAIRNRHSDRRGFLGGWPRLLGAKQP